MFKILLHKEAAHYYNKLDANQQKRMNQAIEEIKKNPYIPQKTKKLKGRLEGKYSYRLSHFRIIYFVDEKNEIIYIEAIGPRGDIYKP